MLVLHVVYFEVPSVNSRTWKIYEKIQDFSVGIENLRLLLCQSAKSRTVPAGISDATLTNTSSSSSSRWSWVM